MKKEQYSISDLQRLMERLREPDYGCPWDLAQTYQSIAPSTLEEAYEVVDAIENQDYDQLKDELGDLLFQVIFYSQLGKEDGHYDFDDIVAAITAKLLRRHPHVFPDGSLESRMASHQVGEEQSKEREASIKASWEQIKQEERVSKGFHNLMDDIPRALPATVRANKLQKRAANVGFDWPSVDGIYAKLEEELGELRQACQDQERECEHGKQHDKEHIEEELGDVLFTVINLARHLKIEPETALRKANTKFEQRFAEMERCAESAQLRFEEQDLRTLETWWQRAKDNLSSQ